MIGNPTQTHPPKEKGKIFKMRTNNDNIDLAPKAVYCNLRSPWRCV